MGPLEKRILERVLEKNESLKQQASGLGKRTIGRIDIGEPGPLEVLASEHRPISAAETILGATNFRMAGLSRSGGSLRQTTGALPLMLASVV